MKSLKKNLCPTKKSINNTLLNSQNEQIQEKHSKISKLIEETINQFNIKYTSITNTLNQIKQDLLQKMTNIQEIYLEENLSTLNSGGGYHHKVNNKSVNYNTTRNFLQENFIKFTRNDSKRRALNQKINSITSEAKNININSIYSPQKMKSKLTKNNKKVFRPIKPHLTYNSNFNKKENERKSKQKQIMQKNVSFNSRIVVNNGINEIQLNDTASYYNKIRLNSEDSQQDKSIIDKSINEKFPNKNNKKALEILKNSQVLSVEEKMNNISNNYSNNNQKDENEKNNNLNNVKSNNKKSNSSSKNSFSSQNESNISIDLDIVDNKKTIFPSRTTQIGINFLTQEKEDEIYNENSNEAKKICELIYIILEEESQFEEKNDVKTLFKYLLNTFKVNSIKDLFFKVIYEKVYINNSIDNGIYKVYNRLITKHFKEFKLICKATNEPLSWLAMNVLEISKYLQLVFNK